MNSSIRIGLDIGSTTIKMVALDGDNRLLFSDYRRHLSAIPESFHTMITAAHTALTSASLSIQLTGSAAMGLAQELGLPFVQEVIASTTALRRYLPDTDVAIELGGEDAKITYLGTAVEQRMNGVCAGGTGAFIDHMASLLNTDPAGLNQLAKNFKVLHPIASRCGVFAKTDVQSLLNEGIAKTDIAASILQAVVNQTIGSLAQGRPIVGKIAFLGGPLHFLSSLRQRFVDTLHLKDQDWYNPETSAYFVALGAALAAPSSGCLSYEQLLALSHPDKARSHSEGSLPLEPLFSSPEEYQKFSNRHARNQVPRAELSTYSGNAFLGLDAGSTTLKLALVSSDGKLLYSHYGSNQGHPLDTAKAALNDLYQQLNSETRIAYSLVTGYGEHFLKAAFHMDQGEVETLAHLTAARQFAPKVSFVLDIGGQDMKSFVVRGGMIDSIVLNEACSSGCGSFMENFANALNMPIDQFARLGLEAKNPVDLGTRCTVFMNSRVKQVQKEGAPVSDISAGLALSVVKNALFKVIRMKNTESLGHQIVVQGGTFYNDSVLRAFEQISGQEVIRPDIAGLMGAYGAALMARNRWQGQPSTLISREGLHTLSSRNQTYRCHQCGNHCLITAQHFDSGQTYHSGNRCERGSGKTASVAHLPNLYSYKEQRVFAYTPLPETDAPRGTLGIPRVLNMYEDYPFWFTLFTHLGYRVILSDRSDRVLYEQGMETIPSDSLCYPTKLVHGHIQNLAAQGIPAIFYPCIPYNLQENPNADDCYNCPVVTSYPANIQANMDILRQQNIRFYHPFLPIAHRSRLIQRLQEEWKDTAFSKKELTAAVDAAYAEWDRYKKDVQTQGEQALAFLEEKGLQGILLAGRPYHVDPEINHGLPELLQSYGLVVLSEDSICHLTSPPETLRVVDQWVYHSRLYMAAKFSAAKLRLEFVQLNSFGCGLDAVTMDQVKEILENHGRLYTSIKLDEINNLGAARIRIRSLLSAVHERNQRNKKPLVTIPLAPPPPPADAKRHTLLAPQMSPIHFSFLETAFQSAGYRLTVASMPNKQAVEEGLRYVSHDACYPSIIVTGQIIHALKSGDYDLSNTSVLLSQTGGGCRATNYAAIARKALSDAGLGHVPVLAMGSGSSDLSLSLPLMESMVIAVIYGDLFMRLLLRTRPYEQEPGAADALCAQWMAKCQADMRIRGRYNFRENIRAAVKAFDKLPLKHLSKPRVGIVGEILVKYHPMANNNLIQVLESEGAEAVVPDMLDFFLYCALDSKTEYELLAGTLRNRLKSSLFIHFAEFYRRPMRKALQKSQRFSSPYTIQDVAAMASPHISLGHCTGEGWLLTGEMLELLHSGVNNIVCVQPFACLPNHITGKGMLREIRRIYPKANIAPIDYDPGASEVNQLNRIKLMLAVAHEQTG